MPESTWTVAEPRKLAFDEPVTALNVRIVDGMVNVVGTDEPPRGWRYRDRRSAADRDPRDGTLAVAYEDVPWQGFLQVARPQGTEPPRGVSVAVPAGAAWRSAWSGRGGRLRDPGAHRSPGRFRRHHPGRAHRAVRAETVSGNVETQASPASSASSRSPVT